MNEQGNLSLPFLTADLPGVGGVIKARDEDFIVEEVPLYPSSGQGTHIYALIEKKGIPTIDALRDIARALGRPHHDIGYAGLKDARSVARQWISVEHVDPARLNALEVPRVKVLRLERHTNKIKLGHLAANRFTIRLRQVRPPAAEAVRIIESIMTQLAARGVPNYFGEQRFGARSDTQLLGEAVSKGRIDDFIDIFVGRPDPRDAPNIARARSLYERGDYEKAHDAWPYTYADQRRVLKALVKKGGSKKRAYHVVDKRLKGFFVSAYQSDLFNRAAAARMPRIDKLLTGDMAYKHVNGACFRVEDAAIEQPRADAFEISPTGPLVGHRMTELTGPAGDIENPVLALAPLTSRDFRQMAEYGARGGRRPLRFQPRDIRINSGTDDLGQYIQLDFELDPGCYATALLREITKQTP